MTQLVEQNYLHWNHYLIFEYSVKAFQLLWELMKMRNDSGVIRRFSESRGLEFLGIAEVVLGLSQEFLPYGYMESHVLPLRLAAIIKLRDLTNQLSKGSTSLRKIDPIIATTYFRSKSEPISQTLYQRSNRDGSNLTMEFIEGKVLRALARVVNNIISSGKKVKVRRGSSSGGYLDALAKEAPYLVQMFKTKFGEGDWDDGLPLKNFGDEESDPNGGISSSCSTDTFPFNLMV
jgi:hypothetical protein